MLLWIDRTAAAELNIMLRLKDQWVGSGTPGQAKNHTPVPMPDILTVLYYVFRSTAMAETLQQTRWSEQLTQADRSYDVRLSR